jgi:hypothetical protein
MPRLTVFGHPVHSILQAIRPHERDPRWELRSALSAPQGPQGGRHSLGPLRVGSGAHRALRLPRGRASLPSRGAGWRRPRRRTGGVLEENLKLRAPCRSLWASCSRVGSWDSSTPFPRGLPSPLAWSFWVFSCAKHQSRRTTCLMRGLCTLRSSGYRSIRLSRKHAVPRLTAKGYFCGALGRTRTCDLLCS